MELIIVLSLLGIVQGITEFLPISSSGHLSLIEYIPIVNNYMNNIQINKLFFNVILHLASLIAIIIFYKNDIKSLILGIIDEVKLGTYDNNLKFIFNIIIATIPAVIVGLTLNSLVESLISKPVIISLLLIFNGFILLYSNKFKKLNRKCEQISMLEAFIIGVFQSFAILPGISRSGSTIFAGLMFKMEPVEAAKFSFFLAIPAIIGAGFLESLQLINSQVHINSIIPITIAFIITMIAALISLKILIRILKSFKLKFFGIYTIALGIISIILIYIF